MKLKIKTEHKKLPKGKLSEIRSRPGESNAYKHKGDGPYAGPNHSFPIKDKTHARNALSRAHFASDPVAIKEKVHARFPDIGKKDVKKTK